MSRRHRPLLGGVLVALGASGAGVAVNVATEHHTSMLAWLAVAGCTFASGAITSMVGRARVPPAPGDETRVQLVIEWDIRSDGSRNVRMTAHSQEAARLALERHHVLAGAPGAIPPPENGALPRPLPVSLITRPRNGRIVRQLRDLGSRYAASEVLVPHLCVEDDHELRRERLRTASVVIMDDHGTGGLDLADLRGPDGRGVRAPVIVLGCHEGAGQAVTEALRRSLDRPAAFLGCARSAPAEHAPLLFPAVLDALGGLAGSHATAEQLRGALDAALARVQTERPQMDWARWRTAVLLPHP